MSITTATQAPTASPGTAAAASNAALNAISGNFNDFLSLLTTQLQNQDPSSPMDTSQFTSELAQFAGVQQQVDTNTNLSTLIGVSQTQALLQGTSLMGKAVNLNSTTLPLQNGAASLQFSAPAAGPVQVTIADSTGAIIATTTLDAVSGSNTWQWNGQNGAGLTEPDGAYTASVSALGAGGSQTPLGFTTGGTVTGIVNNAGTIDLQFGPTSLPFADLATIGT